MNIKDQKKNFYSKLTAGGAWLLLGSCIQKGSTLFLAILIARHLGQSGYGEFGVIQACIMVLQVFASFGVVTATTKFVAEYHRKDILKTGRIISLSYTSAIILGGGVTGLLIFFSDQLAGSVYEASQLSNDIKIASLAILFSTINGVQQGILSGVQRFKEISRISIYTGLLSIPITIYFTYLMGLQGAALSITITAFIGCLLSYFSAQRALNNFNIPYRWVECLQEIRIMYTFNIPAFLGSLMVAPAMWVCTAMLVRSEAGFEGMGVFNVVNQWLIALMFIPSILNQVVLPLMCDKQDNNLSPKTLLFIMMKTNAYLLAPVVLFLSILSPYILQLYGNEYQGEWQAFILVLFTAWLSAILLPIGNAIASENKMWVGVAINGLWAFNFIMFSYLFIGYGVLGILFARLLAYVLNALISILLIRGEYIFLSSHLKSPLTS